MNTSTTSSERQALPKLSPETIAKLEHSLNDIQMLVHELATYDTYGHIWGAIVLHNLSDLEDFLTGKGDLNDA